MTNGTVRGGVSVLTHGRNPGKGFKSTWGNQRRPGGEGFDKNHQRDVEGEGRDPEEEKDLFKV